MNSKENLDTSERGTLVPPHPQNRIKNTESEQQTIHIKELRRSWWDIGNVGSAHPIKIKRWWKGWMLILHMYIESDTYLLRFSILDYGKKNFCRFSKDEINTLESFMQECAKKAYEKRHEPPSYEITRK